MAALSFMATLAVGVVIAAASFFDHTLVYDLAPAVAGGAAVFHVGMSRARSQAFAGLACAVAVVAVAVRNDPGGGVDDVAAITIPRLVVAPNPPPKTPGYDSPARAP